MNTASFYQGVPMPALSPGRTMMGKVKYSFENSNLRACGSKDTGHMSGSDTEKNQGERYHEYKQ